MSARSALPGNADVLVGRKTHACKDAGAPWEAPKRFRDACASSGFASPPSSSDMYARRLHRDGSGRRSKQGSSARPHGVRVIFGHLHADVSTSVIRLFRNPAVDRVREVQFAPVPGCWSTKQLRICPDTRRARQNSQDDVRGALSRPLSPLRAASSRCCLSRRSRSQLPRLAERPRSLRR